MTIVVRDAEGNIQYFADRADGLVLSPGQRAEESPLSFAEYAARLVLSVGGVSGETILVPAGGGEVIVRVSCAPSALGHVQSVELDINGTLEKVPLIDGAGQVILSCLVPGVFVIQPADRALYPASGSSLLAVMVQE
jgi:hypothetical protein